MVKVSKFYPHSGPRHHRYHRSRPGKQYSIDNRKRRVIFKLRREKLSTETVAVEEV